jgi:hypothetical protein
MSKPLWRKAVAFGLDQADAADGFARQRGAAGVEADRAIAVRARLGGHFRALFRVLGLVVDDAADGGGAVAQTGRALQHLDALHALDARAVVGLVGEEQARCDGNAVLEHQQLLAAVGVEAAHPDVGDEAVAFFLANDDARDRLERILGRQRLHQLQFLLGDDRDRTGLFCDGVLAFADHIDARQLDLGGHPQSRESSVRQPQPGPVLLG